MTELERGQIIDEDHRKRLAGKREHNIVVASTGEAVLCIYQDDVTYFHGFVSLEVLEEFCHNMQDKINRIKASQGKNSSKTPCPPSAT